MNEISLHRKDNKSKADFSMTLLIKEMEETKIKDIEEDLQKLIKIGNEFIKTNFDKLTADQSSRLVSQCDVLKINLLL